MVAIVVGNGLGLEKSSANVLGSRGQLGSAGLGRANDGVTVNAANGNLVIGNRDELLIGRGPDSAISRTYNSLGQFDGDNGDNWRMSMHRRLFSLTGSINTAGSTVKLLDWDSSEILYVYDASRGGYFSTEGAGAYDKIVRNGTGWDWIDGNSQFTERYEDATAEYARITSRRDTERDVNGNPANVITYSYSGDKISRITTADGNYTDLIWSGNNLERLTTTYTDTQTGIQKTLTRTRYTYDGYNRMASVTVDLSPDDNAISDGRVYTSNYTYHGASKLVATINQTDGTLLSFGYDGQNRVTSFTQTVENGITRTTTFAYGAGYTNITDPQNNVTVLTYDGAGQLTRIDEPAADVNTPAKATDFYYYGNGDLYYTSIYQGAQFERTWYRYDVNGNVYDTYEYIPEGYLVTRFIYGAKNELLTSTSYTSIDADGHGGGEPTGAMTTRYVYDTENHLRFVVSPEGRVTEYRYNAPGQRVAEISYVFNSVGTGGLSETFTWSEQDFINWLASIGDKSATTRTDTSYDFRGNIQTVISYAKVDSRGNGILAAGYSQTQYVYDQYGNLLNKQQVQGEPIVSHTSLGEWGVGGLNVVGAGTTLNGQPANQYTVQATGGWSAFYNSYPITEGDTITTAVTLKGTGTSPATSIGLYGYQSAWGDNKYSTARIVSGPGTISQEVGSLWNITGLSNTEETRVEITRTYLQGDNYGGVYNYADRPNGWRAGQGIIASDPVVTKGKAATETYAYDGMGRAIRFTDAKSVGTWTTYMDAQSRTVVTLANGLTQTSNYNQAGELVASSESRATETVAVADFAQWNLSQISGSSAGIVDGAAATKLTINSGQTYGAATSYVPVIAGDTITYSISLQALGGATTQYLGIYGDATGWGQDMTGVTSARVISGGAKINSYYGGLWQVTGLSATEATRVEFTRNFTQAEGAYIYTYVYGETNSPGQGMIVSAANVTKTRYDGITPTVVSAAELKTNIVDPVQWPSYYISKTPAGTTLNYAPATKLTIDAGQTYGATYSYTQANAGDVLTFTVTLQAIGNNTTQLFGLYGGSSGWGDSGVASFRIISGPGTLESYANYGGLKYISGLSNTAPTRVEVTRTYTQAETAYAYVYALSATGSPGDVSLVAATSLTRSKGNLTDYRYDSLGRLRIKIDPAGVKTFYFYDKRDRKIADVAGDGAVTEYKYDAADRAIATVQYATALNSQQLSTLFDPTYVNPTAVEFSSLRPAATANDRWNWNVYDKAGRLIQTIDAYGGTAEFVYDGAGRIKYTWKRYYQLSAAQLEGFKVTAPTARIVPPDYAGMDRVTQNYYDNDNRLIGTMDEEGYLTQYVYDKAGRQTETVRYWNLPNLANRLTDAFSTLLASAGTSAYDARAYAIYDGRGLVAATVDGEGNLVRYTYDARGNVAREERGQKVAANTLYTLATLPASSGDLQITNFVRDARGQVTGQTRVAPTGNLTSSFAYDVVGNLTSTTDARGNQSYKYYDAKGRLVREEIPLDAVAGTWAVTRYEYDSRGNVIKVIDPRGNASYNYYDDRSRLVLAIDAEGYATETSYTTFGQVAWVRRYQTKPSGAGNPAVRPTLVGHSNDATTYFFYDLRGLVIGTTDAEGKSENSYYNTFGQKYQHTNKLGGAEHFAYYRRGQLYYSWTNEEVKRDDGSTQLTYRYKPLYHYDARGNVSLMVEAHALTERRDTVYSYDRNNRLTSKYTSAVSTLNISNGVETSVYPTDQYKYDARGNLIETIDPVGARTLHYYDQLNRKIAEINAVGTHKTWSYDGNGNVTVERVYGGFTSLPGTAGGTPPAPSGTPREIHYSYDRNNRVIEKRVYGVLIGRLNGTTFERPTADLVTGYQYDAAGNVMRETDARGNSILRYYDKNGREIAKVDQESYLTTWIRDSEGNVLEDRRFANKVGTQFAFSPNVASSVADMVSSSGYNGLDRVTVFAYDKMGRRLHEGRYNVNASQISGNSVVAGAVHSYIFYTYNAFGEVLSKTEGNGDRTDYTYDTYGKMTSRSDPGFTNQNGVSVRPTTNLYYDGLNNLVYERPSDAVSGGEARSTRYSYGAGGRLAWVMDTAGRTKYYKYDAAGRVVEERYDREKSNGSNVVEAKYTSYDAVGRVVGQFTAVYDGGWSYLPTQSTAYNAYGDVASKGVNGAATELFFYDNAGRVVMTNSGDGVWKYFAHDENGNATLTLVNTAITDLAHVDQSWTTGYLTGWAAAIDISSFNQYYTTASVAAYDKRGMMTDNYEPGRTIAVTGNEAATTTQTLHVKRWYNAFGETTQEKSARGHYTNYTYNAMGRLLQKQSAETNVTLENGAIVRQRPTENYAYDLSGRQIASQNANGFWTTRLLLAGTGYGDNEGLVTVEYRPDGSAMSFGYDVHGNLRKITDGLGRVTLQDYNTADQLVKVTRANGLVEEYGYDLLGQRIRKWNNVFQSPIYGTPVWVESGYWDYNNYYNEPEWIDNSYWYTPITGYNPTVETTDYDGAGRVTSTKNFAGDVTNIVYGWNGGLATNGLGTFGGWLKTTYRPDGYYAQEYNDVYGRLTWRRDLGGREYNYTFNEAGQLAQQTSTAGQNIAYTYYNTGRMATMVDNAGVAYGYSTSNIDGTYTYDADGNRTYERLAGTYQVFDPYGGYGGGSYSTVHQEGRGTYDELGRLTNFIDGGASGNGPINIVNEYDAASNVRRTATTYRPFNGVNGTLGASDITQDYWYKYDAMDRMVTVMGILVGARGSGTIARSTGGYGGASESRDITYNLAGERATSARTQYQSGYYGAGTYYEVREQYEYNSVGAVTAMRIANGAAVYGGYYQPAPTSLPSATGAGMLRATTGYDLLGRVTSYSEYKADGSGQVQFNRYSINYDNRNAMTGETSVLDRVESDGSRYVSYSTTTNTYGAGGILNASYSNNYRYKNGSSYQNSDDTSNTYTYAWWDSAVQATLSHDSNTGSYSNAIWVTNYQYDYNGHLTSAQINDGRPRTVSYVNDAGGQVLSRITSSNQAANPKQLYYFFDGKQIGANGNDGNDDPSFETSLAERVTAGPTNPGFFRNGAKTATAFADFDQAYDPVNAGNLGGVGSGYVVRNGDTLQSVAQAVLGDGSLWYMIADANGLSGGSQLVAGQSLTIPTGPATNVHNKADTFRPYDASRAIGDTQPNMAAPPKKPKCGIFGQILLAVIAAAVTAVTAGTIGPVAAAMLGSVVSQGVGVATGIQEKFSFKAVAMAGIGAAVGAGLGALKDAAGTLGKVGNYLAGSGFINSVARGVVSNVITQGVGVATGLQKKFDWAGVAAAGIAAGVGNVVGKWAGKTFNSDGNKTLEGLSGDGANLRFDNMVGHALTGIARSIASSAARSIVNGTDFGDNLVSALPDAIGSTIGELLVGGAQQIDRNIRADNIIDALGEGYDTNDFRTFAKQALGGGMTTGEIKGIIRSTQAMEAARFAVYQPDSDSGSEEMQPTLVNSTVRGGRIWINPEAGMDFTIDLPNNVGADGVTTNHVYLKARSPRENLKLTGKEGLRAVSSALKQLPTPTDSEGNDSKGASPQGTINDVGGLVPGLDNGPNLVKSYWIPSFRKNMSGVVVNYTVRNNHILSEGFVIRFATMDAKGIISLHTYGEGNSILQSKYTKPFTAKGEEYIWNRNSDLIFERAFHIKSINKLKDKIKII